jgi:hypothetical protein
MTDDIQVGAWATWQFREPKLPVLRIQSASRQATDFTGSAHFQ